MKINKIVMVNGDVEEVAVDLTNDTATANDVAAGKVFHLPNGESAVGVATQPTGTLNIPNNGSHNVASYATAIVAVPEHLPESIDSAAGMDAVLIAANVGKVYLYTGTTTSTYTNGYLYVVEES